MKQNIDIGKLDQLPRVKIGHLPTPMERLERISDQFEAKLLLVKRDDCTGVGLGGNKVRQLEFHFGLARSQGADIVLVTGATQSNYVRTTAAFAAKLGMKCHVQLEDRVPGVGELYKTNGNVFLDRLFGATISTYDEGEDEHGADRRLRQIAKNYEEEGHRSYIVPLAPGNPPVSALGYVNAAREILAQRDAEEIVLDEIVVASGSGETHAGILYGLRALGAEIPVTGICVRRTADLQLERVRKKVLDLNELTGLSIKLDDHDIQLIDRYLSPGYGLINDHVIEAMKLGGHLEGLILDPTYTAKTFAGFIERVKDVGRNKSLMFIHTGGTPAVFAYQDQIQPRL
ncbi:MAG: D-cysteine desulfhydrase family protein [Methyloligellaceae bacterium]